MAASLASSLALLAPLTLAVMMCSGSARAELERFEHSPKPDGSLSFLVVGDWGRRGFYNQTEVALQVIILFFYKSSLALYLSLFTLKDLYVTIYGMNACVHMYVVMGFCAKYCHQCCYVQWKTCMTLWDTRDETCMTCFHMHVNRSVQLVRLILIDKIINCICTNQKFYSLWL